MKKICFLVLIILFSGRVAFAGQGRDAGYKWAQEHHLMDADYNKGKSESFNEGVRQYAQEQLALENDPSVVQDAQEQQPPEKEKTE